MGEDTPTGKLSLAPASKPPCIEGPLSQMCSSIPVSHIRAVERVDEGAFQLPHVMQVVTQDGAGALHTTYLQCKVRPRENRGGAEGSLRSYPTSDRPPQLPPECERPQPMAVGPAQGQRPQPRQAGRLPPRCLPQRALDLLPPGRALR